MNAQDVTSCILFVSINYIHEFNQIIPTNSQQIHSQFRKSTYGYVFMYIDTIYSHHMLHNVLLEKLFI